MTDVNDGRILESFKLGVRQLVMKILILLNTPLRDVSFEQTMSKPKMHGKIEHKHSAIGKHLRDSHNQENKDLTEQFTILKKCRGKFECLIYEMLFIQEKKPKLNTQSDSIKAKLFST